MSKYDRDAIEIYILDHIDTDKVIIYHFTPKNEK